MKYLVNAVQIAVVMVLLYPVAYFWDTGRVDALCDELSTGMSTVTLFKLAEHHGVSVNTPVFDSGSSRRWTATAPSILAFNGYRCEIRGSNEMVATATIRKNSD